MDHPGGLEILHIGRGDPRRQRRVTGVVPVTADGRPILPGRVTQFGLHAKRNGGHHHERKRSKATPNPAHQFLRHRVNEATAGIGPAVQFCNRANGDDLPALAILSASALSALSRLAVPSSGVAAAAQPCHHPEAALLGIAQALIERLAGIGVLS